MALLDQTGRYSDLSLDEDTLLADTTHLDQYWVYFYDPSHLNFSNT